MNSEFSLRARREGGGTPVLQDWGVDSEYGLLRDVLLGPADNYKWLETSSVSKKSIRRNYDFDGEVARRQHAEMVAAYESAGVKVHLHAADAELPYQVFARY
jgi:N-dimethylarginine dimethylaminohydrolase